MNLITIATTDQYKALIYKMILEEESITVFLQNEISSQLYGNIFEVKIQVPDTQAKKALDILIESGYNILE